jgi:hypothetical protein
MPGLREDDAMAAPGLAALPGMRGLPALSLDLLRWGRVMNCGHEGVVLERAFAIAVGVAARLGTIAPAIYEGRAAIFWEPTLQITITNPVVPHGPRP